MPARALQSGSSTVLRILMVTIGSLRVPTSALHGSVLEHPHFTTLIHSGLYTVSEACLSVTVTNSPAAGRDFPYCFLGLP